MVFLVSSESKTWFMFDAVRVMFAKADLVIGISSVKVGLNELGVMNQ